MARRARVSAEFYERIGGKAVYDRWRAQRDREKAAEKAARARAEGRAKARAARGEARGIVIKITLPPPALAALRALGEGVGLSPGRLGKLILVRFAALPEASAREELRRLLVAS